MTINLLSENGDYTWPGILASAPLLVIYKHSPACGTAAAARTEVAALCATIPEVPIFQVDVIHQRGLSRTLAAELGVGHESPQVILVCDGKAVWNTSHFRIHAASLVTEIARTREACLQRARRLAGREA